MKKLLFITIAVLFLSCESKEHLRIQRYNDSLKSIRDSIEPLFLKSVEKHGKYTSKAYEFMILNDSTNAYKYADSAKIESKKVNDIYLEMYPEEKNK